MLIAPEERGAPYDRFRERVMFPIGDQRGRIISFGGRALNPEARAKYLNGSDTALFNKGRTLYGLPEARRLLHAPRGRARRWWWSRAIWTSSPVSAPRSPRWPRKARP